MKTFIVLPFKKKRTLPQKSQQDDNRYPESLVEYFLNEYTEESDKVLDVFTGFGTTLFVAERMERIPFGIEFDNERYEYVKDLFLHLG